MKKILSLTLCVLLIILSFGSFSFAKDNNASGGNAKFLRMTGICENTNLKDDEVLTRIELAKMYYKILTGKSIPEYTEYRSPYSDIGEEEYGFIKPVADAGIMTGISKNVFGKDEPVTYAQLIKTVVTLLGYNTHAMTNGGWPSGYLTVASQLGITKSAPTDSSFYVTLNGAADVFRLAAGAKMVVRTSYDENETYETYSGGGFLEYYMGIITYDGIVNANSTYSIDDASKTEFGEVRIGNTLFSVSQDSIGIYDLIGQSVTVFYSKHSPYAIKYFEALDNNVTVINSQDISSVTDEKISYYESDGKEVKLNYPRSATILYNGEVLKNYTLSNLNPFVSGLVDGCIKVIDNSGDKKPDIISIEAYEAFLCGGVRDMVAFSKVVKGKFADFSEFGENSLAILNAVGEPISYDAISEDDVLNCYYTLGGKLTKIVVTIDFGSGKIEEIEKDGNAVKALYISGKKYECGASFNLSPDASSLKPGDEVTFWFNKDARIGVIEKGDVKTKIALLTDYAKPQGLGTEYRVRLFETGGTFSEYVLAEKIKVANGQIEPKDFESYVGKTGDKVTRQLIKYGLNSEGNLNTLILADSAKDSDGTYATEFFIYDGFDGTTAKAYREELYTFGLGLYLESSTKVFVLPSEAERDIDDAYAVKNRGTFNNGNYKIIAYGTDKYSPVADAVIYYSSISSNPSSATRYFAVSKITQTVDENGDEFVKVSGFHGDTGTKGQQGFIKAESIDSLKIGPNGSLVGSGDVIKYTTDATGVLKNAVLILDKSENKLHNMNNPNGAFPATGIRYSYGEVVSNDGAYITVELKNTNGSVTYESYPISRFTDGGIKGTVNERTGEVTYSSAKASDIFDRNTYGSKCTKVFTNINGPWWIVGILYN